MNAGQGLSSVVGHSTDGDMDGDRKSLGAALGELDADLDGVTLKEAASVLDQTRSLS